MEGKSTSCSPVELREAQGMSGGESLLPLLQPEQCEFISLTWDLSHSCYLMEDSHGCKSLTSIVLGAILKVSSHFSPKSVSDRALQGCGLSPPPDGSSLPAAAGARRCQQIQDVQKRSQRRDKEDISANSEDHRSRWPPAMSER